MINDRLTLSQIALLSAYAVGMSAGQVLFKLASLRYVAADTVGERLLGLVQNAYFLGAVILYAGFAAIWVWILTFTPLSRAYPFVALAFALTPVLGAVMFGEEVPLRLFAGIILILCGLALVTS